MNLPTSKSQQAAYEVNGRHVERALFYQIACDPKRSVVVEACAGAGKTWMLVSRIIRSLLDGIAPQHILAITFTKKAAGEMRERLHDWLALFAGQTEAQRMQELQIRGLSPERAAELAPTLADLHHAWLVTGRSVEIHTIHGWFSRLLRVAPLDVLTELRLPPQLSLIEDQSELWPELWGRLLRRVDRGEALHAYTSLVKSIGGFNLEGWLQSALSNRLEIELADAKGVLDSSIESVASWSDQWSAWAHPDLALGETGLVARMWDVARLLGASKGATAQEAASRMTDALGKTDLAQRGLQLSGALLTAQGQPKKRMGDGADLAWAQDWLMAWHQARAQHEAHEVQQAMCALCRVLFAEYAQLKAERGLADMSDLELAASRLLTDPVLAGWVQERLDGQTQQLLMDEFQDTSPLQWQTLREWLAAYAGAGGGRSGQQPMKVFLVGDPKQSIYRFRRADPRVFEAAKQFIVEGLGGDLLACDHTRRNAPGVIHALNQCMELAARQGDMPGYRVHTTESIDASRVCALPTIPRSAIEKQAAQEGWRDSLTTPRVTEQASLRQLEAEQIAQAVAHVVRVDGIAPSEVYVLARKRASLHLVANALSEAGLPNVAPENTLLADTAEVRDLIAVMDALVSPHHDLSVAHALKSPVFMIDDAALLELAHVVQAKALSWWEALQDAGLGERFQAPAGLLRSWQDASTCLPPHDLLERIVSESGLQANLARCLGPGRYEAAWSNIEALLAFSLEMDSGRDATAYKWIRSIKRATTSLTAKAQANAVQLLTIHGAKGLEAEVVFLMDCDALPGKAETYGVLVDWPAGMDHPARCAFVKSEAKPPPSLSALLETEAQAADREELNALYVAMTRAKSQLLISRVEPRYQAGKPSWWQRLVESHAVDASTPWEIGLLPESMDESACTQNPSDKPETVDMVVNGFPLLPDLPSTTRQEPGDVTDAQLLGQVVHRVLEWVTTVDEDCRSAPLLARAIDQAIRELKLPMALKDQAEVLIQNVLNSAEAAPWLTPTGVIWAGNEVPLHFDGQSLRLDRLLARQGEQGVEWWVLDYKLSHQPQELEPYRDQMRQYIRAVSFLQPQDEVRGAFITGSGRFVPFSSFD